MIFACGKIYFKVVPQLISNLSYMFFQMPRLPEQVNEKLAKKDLPDDYKEKIISKFRKLLNFSQRVAEGSVSFSGLNLMVCAGPEEKVTLLVQLKPEIQMRNSEMRVSLQDLTLRYGTLLFSISDLRKQNLDGIFDHFSRFNNPTKVEFLLLRRS